MHDPVALLEELRSLDPSAQAARLAAISPSRELLLDLEWEAAIRRDGYGHPEMRLGNGAMACAGSCGLIGRGNRRVDLSAHPLFFATLAAGER
jgi:hypothetical protein